MPKIKISKIRYYERFHEILITDSELEFCHDVGTMYKISKTRTKKLLSVKQFNSSSAMKIQEKKLIQIINELFDEIE